MAVRLVTWLSISNIMSSSFFLSHRFELLQKYNGQLDVLSSFTVYNGVIFSMNSLIYVKIETSYMHRIQHFQKKYPLLYL